MFHARAICNDRVCWVSSRAPVPAGEDTGQDVHGCVVAAYQRVGGVSLRSNYYWRFLPRSVERLACGWLTRWIWACMVRSTKALIDRAITRKALTTVAAITVCMTGRRARRLEWRGEGGAGQAGRAADWRPVRTGHVPRQPTTPFSSATRTLCRPTNIVGCPNQSWLAVGAAGSVRGRSGMEESS